MRKTSSQMTVSSSNPALIPAPQVTYLSPATTGTVSFVVAPSTSGTSILSVVVWDSEGASVTQSFNVTVQATNHPPTISDIPNQVTTGSTAIVIGFQVAPWSSVRNRYGLGAPSKAMTVGTGIPLGRMRSSSPRSLCTSSAARRPNFR